MNSKADYTSDIIVAGAGFAGSLMAMILNKIGFRVGLIEKDSHPRFAIGESSTPVADMILRDLAEAYDLPWLAHFSRYGSWQQYHPGVVCGLKRGFSYFKHHPDQSFSTNKLHENELLVAASEDNERSDTNWLRSDFDAFLVRKAMEQDIWYWDQAEISRLERSGSIWNVSVDHNGTKRTLTTSWIIDATGSGRLLGDKLGNKSSSSAFLTHSRAVFSHFREVRPWSEWLNSQAIDGSDYPFNPDHSALHHLLDEGWMWMLRFNNGLTSSGVVINGKKNGFRKGKTASSAWQEVVDSYPSLQQVFNNAVCAPSPGRKILSPRLQRRAERGTGDGWVALPHTIGFVDPLHSTGIAHTLSGVERIAHLFKTWGDRQNQLRESLKKYEEAVFNELSFIDLLVSGCLDTTHHMELFHLYSMLYFTATIAYEQNRLRGNFDVENDQFLSAGHPAIPASVRERYSELQKILNQENMSNDSISLFRKHIQHDIEPYNTAGLLRPAVPNMYRHTAVKL